MSAIDDVRAFIREAEDHESDATDCRIQAQAVIDLHGLCPDPSLGGRSRRACCGDPDECEGRSLA